MEKKINRGVIRTGETDIKVHLIDSFPNHPYHVFDDEDMTELAASIEANGLLNPIIVRSKADGRYELIVGRLRKRLEAAGLADFITTKFGVGYLIEN